MKTITFLLSLAMLCSRGLNAQNAANSVVKSTEFSIPTSPAFDLLAINPSQISRPNTIRDFKVDWSFRSWRLKPNLAVQAQPVWELVYNRPDLTKYRNASPFMKTLSTLDVSAGTIEDDAQNRRASLALKINLYRQRDPLKDMKLFAGVDTAYQARAQAQKRELDHLKQARKEAGISPEQKMALGFKTDSLRQVMDLDAKAQKERIQTVAATYVQSYWNAAHVDLACGKIFSYQNAAIDSLSLRGQAFAVWLNASLGVGKKILLTGLLKTLFQESADSARTKSTVVTGGLGLRYGSPKFNFFTEVLYSSPNSTQVLTTPDRNLTQLQQFSVVYGGDWRISYNVMLSYGVRVDYSSGLKFKNILPVAGVSCMMR